MKYARVFKKTGKNKSCTLWNDKNTISGEHEVENWTGG